MHGPWGGPSVTTSKTKQNPHPYSVPSRFSSHVSIISYSTRVYSRNVSTETRWKELISLCTLPLESDAHFIHLVGNSLLEVRIYALGSPSHYPVPHLLCTRWRISLQFRNLWFKYNKFNNQIGWKIKLVSATTSDNWPHKLMGVH